MIPQNLGTLFRDTAERFPDKKAFFFKERAKFVSLSWAEVLKKVDAIACALIERGLSAGDRLAILSENCPQWACVDLAAQSIGVATVPIYTSLTPSEIQYLLADSGSKWVAVSNKSLLEKIVPIQSLVPLLQGIIGFDTALSLSQNDLSIPLILIRDLEKTVSDTRALESRAKAVSPDSLASIIYTSGTTGVPKGVMLTHSNFIHNVVFSKTALKMGERDAHLSFLPLSHVFERTAGYYLMIYIGASIAYAETMETVPQNLLETKPTFILGVPRFYEKIKERVSQAITASGPLKKALFFWAKTLGEEKRKAYFNQKRLSLLFKIKHGLANVLVYKKFKKRLGGRIRFCVSGGAPLAKEVAEFFFDLGVLIYEGYGLTETAPVISANREGRFKFGTVGIPLEGVEVKISEEGEILTKSPCVMPGYFHQPEETQRVLKDGWFYTGDLGRIDKEGFLTITGRKKELIVTSGGKKVAPHAIEELLEKDDLLLRCVLFGEGRKFITALIVPRQEALVKYAQEQKIAYQNYHDLLNDSKIYQMIEGRIEALSKDLANFEKIKYFVLLEHDFTQSAGELTPTLKVKREVVFSRYKDLLAPFYERDRR